MQRRVILSTNNNPDYFFYLPIVQWLWNKFGWEVDVFMTSDVRGAVHTETTGLHVIPDIDGVRPGTLAQVVRHFAANVLPKDDYIMVQDIDLLPLKPWEPDLTKRTIYGWELTGRSFIPVHYTGMMGRDWYDLMGCTGDLKADMEREMKANGRAYEKEWDKYWDADWDILTKRVLPRKNEFTFIPREMVLLGKYHTAKGRVDRCSIEVSPTDNSYSWGYTLNQPDWIDLHAENVNPSSPEKWKSIKFVLEKVFGELPAWMDEHVKNHHSKYGR